MRLKWRSAARLGAAVLALFFSTLVLAQENAGGMAFGVPQLLALNLERDLSRGATLSFHVGTAVLARSYGGRVMFGPTRVGLHPYLGVGLSVIEVTVLDDLWDVGDNSAYLGWTSPGLRYRTELFELFGELSGLFGPDVKRGFVVLGGAGFLLRF